MEEWQLLNYLSGKADPGEVAAVENWLSGHPSNRADLEEIREILKHTESLEELELVDVQKDWSQVRDRIRFEKETGSNSGRSVHPFNLNLYPVLKIAALILIIFIPALLLEKKFDFLGSGERSWISENTVGLKKELVLPDGSFIKLNIHSEISYPVEFDQNKREVRLEGEAFFDVVTLDKKPFMIYTGPELVIEVVGTSFNVNSEDGTVFVQVRTGMVSLYETGKKKDKLLLTEGEEGRYSGQGVFKTDVANPNDISWVTEKLVFKNTPLGDVVKDLSKYSGRQILISGDGMDEQVLTDIFENQELEEILEEIKLILDIEYSINEDTIVLHPTGE